MSAAPRTRIGFHVFDYNKDEHAVGGEIHLRQGELKIINSTFGQRIRKDVSSGLQWLGCEHVWLIMSGL